MKSLGLRRRRKMERGEGSEEEPLKTIHCSSIHSCMLSFSFNKGI
jgi:hypothetical protein